LRHPLLDLLRRQVPRMGRNRPVVAERVFQLAVAIAPEHLLDGHGDLGAGSHRLREHRINVFHVQVDRHRRALERKRTEPAPLRHFVGQHEGRIADLDRGMHQSAVRAGQTRFLDGVECLLIELDRVGRAGTDHEGGEGVHSFGNRLDLRHVHAPFLTSGFEEMSLAGVMGLRRRPPGPCTYGYRINWNLVTLLGDTLAISMRSLLALSLLSAALPLAAEAPAPLFVDRAADWGLTFTYRTGQSGELYMPEIMGGGAALFDSDGDGDLDVFVVQGHPLKPGAADPGPAGWGRLFRNDLITPKGKNPAPRFVDVTEASGIRATGYGMGAATGDYDNDGRMDLYLANFGSNQLWHNNGDGTFTDVTAKAGVDDP